MSRKHKNTKKKSKARFQQLSIFDFIVEEETKSKKAKLLDRAAEKLGAGIYFDSPSDINYIDKYFCLTGKFGFGVQEKCAEIISRKGGKLQKKITTKTDYLVVGKKMNPNWKGKYYGLKIQNALALKLTGKNIRIIKETDLLDIFPPCQIGRGCQQMTFEDFLIGGE